jgi:uncharacterized protein (DUF2141 family)
VTSWVVAGLMMVQAGGAVAPAPVVPSGSDIEVVVSGIRSAQGLVHVDVCPEARFLNSCPYTAEVPAKAGVVTVVLRNVPPGHYAVQAFHDANANHDLDQNFIGIPKEGIGFSNDAMPRLMRPKFKVAAFDHGTTPQRIPVTVRYFLG